MKTGRNPRQSPDHRDERTRPRFRFGARREPAETSTGPRPRRVRKVLSTCWLQIPATLLTLHCSRASMLLISLNTPERQNATGFDLKRTLGGWCQHVQKGWFAHGGFPGYPDGSELFREETMLKRFLPVLRLFSVVIALLGADGIPALQNLVTSRQAQRNNLPIWGRSRVS